MVDSPTLCEAVDMVDTADLDDAVTDTAGLDEASDCSVDYADLEKTSVWMVVRTSQRMMVFYPFLDGHRHRGHDGLWG